jgi:hypothetical protein
MTASSVDGRRFHLSDGDGDGSFVAGQFVTLTDGAGTVRIGQVRALAPDPYGSVLGVQAPGHRFLRPDRAPFADAEVAAADAESVSVMEAAMRATLRVGELRDTAGADARLVPTRFNRHTFWVGQSGSGKTYALGVLLEQLLISTALPLLVFDPNADFVRLGELRASTGSEEEHDLSSRTVRVLRANAADGTPLRVRFTELGMAAKAAVLGIDPIIDRAEYNVLAHMDPGLAGKDAVSYVQGLLASPEPAARALAQRIENKQVLAWSVWAKERTPVNEILASRADATVLELGGFEQPDEHLVVAMSVLDELWARRESRRPMLIVIDEAHNLCSPDGESALERRVRERLIQIAAEGRKFGLWLLLSTQRPSKIHVNVLSQCDNLALMKMTSPMDLAELGRLFGFAPTALLEQSPDFEQGEVLFAGGFTPAPLLTKMRSRLTVEGGADVPIPLRVREPALQQG